MHTPSDKIALGNFITSLGEGGKKGSFLEGATIKVITLNSSAMFRVIFTPSVNLRLPPSSGRKAKAPSLRELDFCKAKRLRE